jgi:transcriptional regulator with XRE-family HTH domain
MNSIELGDETQTSPSSADRLREQAIALRRAGRSRREIKEILGIGSNQTLNEALQGEPPPEWTRRPRAKDDLHARARELREQGLDYEEIAGALGVAKSSVSLWVRDMPRPERLSYEECRKRSAEGAQRYWAAERPVRQARREAIRAAAAAEIGCVTEREILIAGAIAYWCEGAKSKAHRRQDRVVFVNSDPALIRFFLRFLDTVGIGRGDLTYRVHIHETADVLGAERFWQQVTQANPRQFRRTALKIHNPKTVRANVGDGYHGCLRVEVRRSADLYRQIDGWTSSIMADPGAPDVLESAQPGIEPGSPATELPGEDSNLC